MKTARPTRTPAPPDWASLTVKNVFNRSLFLKSILCEDTHRGNGREPPGLSQRRCPEPLIFTSCGSRKGPSPSRDPPRFNPWAHPVSLPSRAEFPSDPDPGLTRLVSPAPHDTQVEVWMEQTAPAAGACN